MDKSVGRSKKIRLLKKRHSNRRRKGKQMKVMRAKCKSLEESILNMNAELEILRDRNMELIQSVHDEQRERIRLLDENEDLRTKYQSLSTMYHEHMKSCFYVDTEEIMLAF